MQWDRVVDVVPNLLIGQVGAEVLAYRLRHANDVLVVDVRRWSAWLSGNQQWERCVVKPACRVCCARFPEESVVVVRIASATVSPPVEMRHLDAQHRSLQRIEATVHADLAVIVLGLHAVIAETAEVVRHIRIVGRHKSAIAKATEILRWEETKATRRATRTGAGTACIAGSNGLRSIFDDRHTKRVRNRQDAVHIHRLPKEMDGHDRLERGALGSSVGDAFGGAVVGHRINVHPDGFGAKSPD